MSTGLNWTAQGGDEVLPCGVLFYPYNGKTEGGILKLNEPEVPKYENVAQ